jgi:TonB-linked SusC/RagA family outer membrane protein
MSKPLPSRALCRLLLLAAGVATGQRALAQNQQTMLPLTGTKSAADTLQLTSGTPPELNKQEVPTVLTPSVVDENGEPLAGVTLSVRNGSFTTVTDSVGQAKLPSLVAGEEIEVRIEKSKIRSYVLRSNDLTPVIELSTYNPAVARLKRVRLLFLGSIRPDLTAASTQTLYNRDIQKVPTTSFLNTLAGRIAGLQAIQYTGLPGSDITSVNLLGQGPVVVIDGIQRSYSSFDPITSFDLEEIESITLLKDALSTSMLGVRGSDGGVLNVVTRRGTPGQPRISATFQTAIQQPLKYPKPLGSYDYATLYNEARVNDGLAPVYTPQDLALYQSGADPIGHPNVDYRDLVLKKSAQLNRYTLSATGGNAFAKYFVSMEHLSQSGLLQTSSINPYNTSNNYKVYVLRSNLDLQLTRKLTGGIRILGRVQDQNDAGATTGTIISNLFNTPANAYPVYNDDGSYGGSQQFQSNVYAQTVNSGYRTNYKRNVISDFYLQRSLDELLSGLYVRATASYFSSLSENIDRSKPFLTFDQTGSGTSALYQQFGSTGNQANSNSISYQSNTTYVEGQLGYQRQGATHGLSAQLLANSQSIRTGSDLPLTVQGISGRASYNYAGKYVAEVSFGLNGSNRYNTSNHYAYGFFPAGGLAWNLSREKFLQDQPWLSFLKLYANLGLTGNDVPGYFSYIQTYSDDAGYFFGTSAGAVSGVSEQQLATQGRTWEKARKLVTGLQGAVLNNHLGFTVEYYNSLYYDLVMQRGTNSALLGQAYANENIGRNLYQGLTGQLSYQQNLGGLNLYAAVNMGVQYTKVLYYDEVTYPNAYQQRTGQRVGQQFGYVADGLFQNAAEIQGAATVPGYKPQPGDIRYKDLNGDGIINQLDVAPIGKTSPVIPFGVTLGTTWKGLDVSVQLQGALNNQVYLSGATEYAFSTLSGGGYGNAFEPQLDRWTPSNPNATYPRLSLGGNVNNFQTSSYWLHNNNYMRLRNVEVGYTLPLALSSRSRLQGIRLFFNGTNLATVSQFNRIDPEGYGAIYPNQRLLNFGMNVKL